MAKPTYREGDWFAVPLRSGGFATGLLARASSRGILLGYFFGPRRTAPASLEELSELRADQAVWIHMFGHLSLSHRTPPDERWPIIGRFPDWDRDLWPMPVFGRYEELTGRWFETYYPNDDPSSPNRQRQVPPGPVEQLPRDGMAGAGYVELWLDRLFGGTADAGR